MSHWTTIRGIRVWCATFGPRDEWWRCLPAKPIPLTEEDRAWARKVAREL